MASFPIRTLDFKRNGRSYKLHIRAESKLLDDEMERLAERMETSGTDQEFFGPFTLIVRRVK